MDLQNYDDLLEKLKTNARKYTENHSWQTIINQFESLLKNHAGLSSSNRLISGLKEVKCES